jgi:peptide/nickel transport system permease protein
VLRFVLRRLFWAIPITVLVTFLVYVALRIGTDPLASYLRVNQRASEKKIQQYIETNGLYEGFGGYIRGYFQWLGGFITGEWPKSIKGSREVWPEFRDAMFNTLRLGLVSSFLGITIGIALGVFVALKPGSLRDSTVNTGAFVAISTPPYVSALLLQLVFAVYWTRWFEGSKPLFPTSGVYPPGHEGFDLALMARHMVLPVTVVVIQVVAVYTRYMRASLLEVLNSEYMRTARSKGISERRVLVRHALRNALIPIVTVAAIDIGAILGGLIITENVFSYPGLGQFFLDAYANGDFPQMMPWMAFFTITVILFNLLADVSYAWLDPRIRLD